MSANIINVTKDNFQSEVLESTVPVLIDFWATWCGPCRMIAPVVEEIAAERQDIKVVKIDVDEESELAIAFAVNSIPTLVCVKNGKESGRSVGFRGKDAILALL